MKCPFCDSDELVTPTIEMGDGIGAGEVQSGPATCFECGASQNGDGQWLPYDDGFGNHHFGVGHHVALVDSDGTRYYARIIEAVWKDNKVSHLIATTPYSRRCIRWDKTTDQWVCIHPTPHL